MGNRLAVRLNTQDKKGRKAWEDLHGKLADVATSIAEPTTTVEALLRYLKREMGSLLFGDPDAQALLGQMMGHVEEKVGAQSVDAFQAIPLLKNLILQVARQLNMTPLRNSVHSDLIDGDSTFVQENVECMVNNSVELSAPSASYTVVSIVGAQSSGKSYLLNQLFRTKFPVMDGQLGRTQTTKGILMSRCIDPSMLVLDIEGFDGRERGQDTLFENQAALFALTVSDLMMVNMFVSDIGRHQGSGRPLFKTIFQERTKLPPGLTYIIVVLRDYDGETPLEILRQDVIKTLEEVWRSVNKESTTFTDYIEINVVALPQKNSEDFQKEVTSLRKLLLKFTRNAKVPASSFSISSKLLWDQIKQNKKLDIPSHMVLLATLYCQQTVEACMGQFNDDLLKAEETPQGFIEVSNTLLDSIINQYNQETELYDAVVRDRECQKMVKKVKKIFTGHYRELIKKIQEETSERFKHEFVRELENMEKTHDVENYDYQKVQSCIEKFTNLCEDLKVFDPEYFHKCCADLQIKLTSYTSFHISSLMEERARKEKKEKERLLTKLDKRMEEKQRLEEEMQREKEKHSREKEEWEQRVHMLQQERPSREKMAEMELKMQMLELEKQKRKAEFEIGGEVIKNMLQIQRERTIRSGQAHPAQSSSAGLIFSRNGHGSEQWKENYIEPGFMYENSEQSIPENWGDNYNYACSGDDYNYADGDTYGMEDTWGDY